MAKIKRLKPNIENNVKQLDLSHILLIEMQNGRNNLENR